MKIWFCRKCGEWKINEDLSLYWHNPGKYYKQCRLCRQRRYHKDKPDYLEYAKQQYKKNIDYYKQRYQNNKKEMLAYHKRWYRNNTQRVRELERKYRARKREAEGNFLESEFQYLLYQYDYKCAMCGRDLSPKITHRDHIVPLSRGGSNDITNIQPLCETCNLSKHTKTIDSRPFVPLFI